MSVSELHWGPTFYNASYQERHRQDFGPKCASSRSAISLTRRKLSEPSYEFHNLAPGIYNLPSIFSKFDSHQIRRPASSWAYSTGRTKALSPEGEHFIATHPLMRKFDGHQLGPGSYDPRLARSGRLVARGALTLRR